MSANRQFLPTDAGTIMVPLQRDDVFPEGWDTAEAIPMFGAEDKKAPVKKELYPRWVRFKVGPNQDNLNYREWLSRKFRNATKTDMTEDTFDPYWDDVQKAYIKGDQILMVGSRKSVVGHMKYNWQAGNGRINKKLNNFVEQPAHVKAPNYIPEAKWEGPVPTFPEDGQ